MFIVLVPKQTQKIILQQYVLFMQQKNKVNINHVLKLTEKQKTMAVKLGCSELLSLLSPEDIVSNKLYYHKSTIKNC